jgi:hypothetical protein
MLKVSPLPCIYINAHFGPNKWLKFSSHDPCMRVSLFFFEKYNINIDTYTHISIYLMNTHTYFIPINIFERLSRFDFKIHEVGHQKCLTVDKNIAYHYKKSLAINITLISNLEFKFFI